MPSCGKGQPTNAASLGENRTQEGKGLFPDDDVVGIGSFNVKTRFTYIFLSFFIF